MGQIDLKIDNTLIQQWKVLYTKVLNELQTLSIIPSNTTCDIGSSASPFRNVYSKVLNLQSGADSLVYTGTQATFGYGSYGNYAHCI